MKSLLSTVALLCAVSFNALQASYSNPHEISEGSTRQIRVITEIPVDMASLVKPRQNCSYFNAGESKALDNSQESSAKKSATEEAILQLIKALTKKLTIPENGSTSFTKRYREPEEAKFGIGTPPAEVVAARDVATKAVSAARAANGDAIRAEDAAEEARNTAKLRAEEEARAREALVKGMGTAEDYVAKSAADDAAKAESEAKLRDAAAAEAKAKRLMATAKAAVSLVDAKAADAVAAGKPAFTYELPQLPRAQQEAQWAADDHFTSNYVVDSAKNSRLGRALKDSITRLNRDSSGGILNTNVDRASQIIKDLRDTGASFTDIYKFFGSADAKSLPDPIKKMALLAIEPYASTRGR